MKDCGFGFLRCPECGSALFQEDESAPADPSRTGLYCRFCAKNYPVVRGIPRFVNSDAYVDNFSLEWSIHSKTQMDHGNYKASSENFLLRFGLSEDFFRNKTVLDAGVGAGRYAQVALKAGAKVWGVDLSFSVDVARNNLTLYKNLHLAQADIFKLPFKKESFDVIYSFGVLHHTPDPQKAFTGLLQYLKPGGLICVSVYPNYGMYHTSRYLRKITTCLPKKVLYFITTGMTLLLYFPYRYLGLRYGILGRFAPISLSDSIAEAILDTYDCYSPKYQFTYSCHEIFQWFKQAGLHDIEVRPQPVTVLGYKHDLPVQNMLVNKL